MTLNGQLTFEGKPIQGVYLDVKGFGKQSVVIDADSQLEEGDYIEATVRWVVTAKGAGSKYDHDGNAISDRNLVYDMAPVYPFEVSKVITKAERDEAWNAHLAETGA